MRSSLIIASLAGLALAAPTTTVSERGLVSWSAPLARFYQEVDKIIHNARAAPNFPQPLACDMTKASMPVAPSPLPTPDADTYLKHIALGRGIQNYTCADSSATTVPAPIGAVASLYNMSCTEANYPSLSSMVTNLIINYPLPSNPNANFQPTNIIVSGHHFFRDNTTPIFDLDTRPQAQYGYAVTKKDVATPAPADAPKGPNGEPAVPWLKLKTVEGTRGGVKHVYRLNTVGGTPPKTCEGRKGTFSVEYAAQYWFYAVNGS